MLEVRGLSLQVGGFHLQDVSLQVHSGACHALIGPSGHGKTLLVETLAGLRSAPKGRIFRDGTEISSEPPESRRLAYVPQDLALFPHLTVAENVRYALRWNSRGDETRFSSATALEERLGITPLRHRRPDNLSGGERQRVALARALASGVRHLLLDEPFSALHESMRREMRRLLLELKEDLGLSILLVTHDLEEAFGLGGSVSLMMDGRVVQSGPGDEVYAQPLSHRIATFLGFRNGFEGVITGQEGPLLRVRCPGLGRDLMVHESRVSPGCRKRMVLGIRSEEVRIVREGQDQPDPWNHFPGRIVYRHDRLAVQTLVFQPDQAEQTMEIDLATRTWRRMAQLPEGELSVSLDPTHLVGMTPDSMDSDM